MSATPRHRAQVPADSSSLARVRFVVRNGFGRHRRMGSAA